MYVHNFPRPFWNDVFPMIRFSLLQVHGTVFHSCLMLCTCCILHHLNLTGHWNCQVLWQVGEVIANSLGLSVCLGMVFHASMPSNWILVTWQLHGMVRVYGVLRPWSNWFLGLVSVRHMLLYIYWVICGLVGTFLPFELVLPLPQCIEAVIKYQGTCWRKSILYWFVVLQWHYDTGCPWGYLC